jgi:hypothetical protein
MMKHIFFLLLFSISANAGQYYVANSSAVTRTPRTGQYVNTADDANAGTSPVNPKETIANAISTASNGDTIWIMGGIWTAGSVKEDPWFFPKIRITKPVTLKAYIADSITDMPVIIGIQASSDSAWCPGVWVEGIDGGVIDSLEFDSCGLAGIYVEGSDSLSIINCLIQHTFELPDRTGEGDGQAFDEINTGGIYVNTSSAGAGSESEDTSRYCLFRNNTIRTIYNPAGGNADQNNLNLIHGRALYSGQIDSNDFSDGWYGLKFKTDWDSNTVEYNTIHDCAHSGVAIGDNTQGNIFRYNLLYNCGGGFQFKQHSSYASYPAQRPFTNWIYNNTVVQGVPSQVAWGIAFGVGGGDIGNVDSNYVFNNIFYDFNSGTYLLAQAHTYDTQQVILDYNDYYGSSPGEDVVYEPNDGNIYQTLAEWLAYSNGTLGWDVDSNSVNVDPQFLEEADSTDADFFRLDIDNTPQALLTGGRGGSWEIFMGAFDPEAAQVERTIINKSVVISGNVRIGVEE